jgi:hypothetical protein
MNSELDQINVPEHPKEFQQAPLLNQSDVVVQDVRTAEFSATLTDLIPAFDTNDSQQITVRTQPREL